MNRIVRTADGEVKDMILKLVTHAGEVVYFAAWGGVTKSLGDAVVLTEDEAVQIGETQIDRVVRDGGFGGYEVPATSLMASYELLWAGDL